MTHHTAAEILRKLIDGINPVTGEVLPKDHLCNYPEVIRALHTAIVAMNETPPLLPSSFSSEPLPFPENTPPTDPPESDRLNRKNGLPNAGRPWTQADSDALIRLYRSGISMEQICKVLNRRERSVNRQLIYLGLIEQERKSHTPPRPGLERVGMQWTQLEDNRLENLYKMKKPIDEISRELGRTPYAVFLRMEKLELYGAVPGYPQYDLLPKWTQEDTKMLQTLFKEGKSVSELADYFGRSEKAISTRLFYMGLLKKCPFDFPYKFETTLK